MPSHRLYDTKPLGGTKAPRKLSPSKRSAAFALATTLMARTAAIPTRHKRNIALALALNRRRRRRRVDDARRRRDFAAQPAERQHEVVGVEILQGHVDA